MAAYKRASETTGRVREIKAVPEVDDLYRRRKQLEREDALTAVGFFKQQLGLDVFDRSGLTHLALGDVLIERE